MYSNEPRSTRWENNRLKAEKYKLQLQNPDDDIKITKGILYHNGNQHDKFDLMTQFFIDKSRR